ncbi:MAG: hypothetical protein ACYTG7_09080 [Planctomycetota bacterium]|jgi:pimeloyl-ACP methyl ester carboxylesterase
MYRLVSILLPFLFIIGGCSNPETLPRKADFKPEQGSEAAELFRAIYHGVAHGAGYSEEEIKKQILLPTRTLMQPLSLDELAASDHLTEVFADRFEAICPSHFYENGLAWPISPKQDSRAVFREKGPVTFVVIPGIFGEFVEDPPFKEVLRNPASRFRMAWHDELARKKDQAYSLEAMEEVEYELSDLVMIGGIDDAGSQEPLVNLIFLLPRMGSLETLGEIEENTQVYLRRLDKVFEIIPSQSTGPLIIMGYSRGATVALELLVRARADAARHPWAERIKGMVSLAGVLYGSGLADQAFEDEDSVEYKLLDLFRNLSGSLEADDAGDSSAELLAKKARNTLIWAEALVKMGAIMATQPLPPAGYVKESIHTTAVSPAFLARMFQFTLTRMFNIDEFGQYFENVRRFQIFMDATITGTKGLTTASRLDWWRKNTVPEDVTYFSIVGTMADMTRKEAAKCPLIDSPYYGQKIPDYKNLRKSFYMLSLWSKVELNDSQVTLPKACFWPGLSQKLNPEQGAFKAYFMGLLGTHHWGIALPFVVESLDKDVNPFPRSELLEAIGTFALENIE